MVSGKSFQLNMLLIWIIIIIMLAMITDFSNGSTYPTIRCIESERQALLDFKKGIIDDPANLLSSWTSIREEDCCKWNRVGCDNHTGHVVMLDLRPQIKLSIMPVTGEISSSLLDLPYLTHLDLSGNRFKRIPVFIGSFPNLTYLDLSQNFFSGAFPYQVGNLSMLKYLDLSWNGKMRVDNIEWLNHLSSLRVLKLSYINFGKDVDWLKAIKMHPSLSTLELAQCQFPEINPSSLSHVNSSKSLTNLHLRKSSFNTTPIQSWLPTVSSVILDLGIAEISQLKGPIPDSFGEMISLVNLDLSSNEFEGSIPTSFGNLCQLKKLDMNDNKLSVSLSSILEKLSCAKKSLEILDLSSNQLRGSIPDFTEFLSLIELYVPSNNLDGSFPKSFKHNSMLQTLLLQRNQLVGPLPSFSNLSSLTMLNLANNTLSGSISGNIGELSGLQFLDLSDNLLSFNVSSDWTPSFQLDTIKLRSCKLGPQFPTWLQSQRNFSYLDISNSQISDSIPDWFWNFPPKLEYLNLSFNQIYGKVPGISLQFYTFPTVDLSNNLFYGLIPKFIFNTTTMDLSKNKFTGSLSFLCTIMHSALNYIDLSDNLLSGGLPDCWAQLKLLVSLNLENNNLSGTIPSSIGSLSQIETLRLRNNSFAGELPSSIKNCSSLALLDLGENKLTGKLSGWVGESLTNLIVLRLRSNEFYGDVPSTICHLTSVQIIDLSFNNLSGPIPSCLNNLTAMTQNQSLRETLIHRYYISYGKWNGTDWNFATVGDGYFDYAWIMWRGIEKEYHKTLGLLKVIDLSSNNLTGEIPEQITSLLGMISLNLSKNSFMGRIPEGIGKLKALEVLDLSHNQLSGDISRSIVDISFLGVLDLSNNQLTGRIPTGTQLQSFNASAYSNNSGLCGPPLSKCPSEGTVQDPSSTGDAGDSNTEAGEEWIDRSSLYAGMGIGFAVGFWGIWVPLLMSSSWRRAYFQFLSNTIDGMYLTILLKLLRRGF